MKKFLPWIIASGGIMLGLPCLAVTFLEDDSGMATCLILLFALNPIYAICAGVYAGKDIKIMGITNSYSVILFGWYMVVFGYRWKGISLICIGLFILRDLGDADFYVPKEKALREILLVVESFKKV